MLKVIRRTRMEEGKRRESDSSEAIGTTQIISVQSLHKTNHHRDNK